MIQFPLHSPESAPQASQPLLQEVRSKLGFVPSLYAGLATSPVALQTYLTLSEYMNRSSLSAVEQQVLALAASAENLCGFCMAAHSTIARRMMKIDDRIVDSLRDGEPLSDDRLEAFRRFVVAVMDQRGFVQGFALDAFLKAGFTQENVLDVIVGVAWKTVSNYANHVLRNPVDAAFADEIWEPARR